MKNAVTVIRVNVKSMRSNIWMNVVKQEMKALDVVKEEGKFGMIFLAHVFGDRGIFMLER